MADSQTTPESNDPPEKTPEEVKEEFWSEHKNRTLGVLDEWFEKKREQYRGTGTSRTGNRNPIEKFITDLVFGPVKKD